MKSFRTLLVLVFLFSIDQNTSAQVFSTLTGGNWNDSTTWVGYKLPGVNDSVIIQGPVTFSYNAKTVNILNITSQGSILDGFASTLTVAKNVWADGILNANGGGVFTVKIGGDLHVNGSWFGNVTFTGTNDHFFSTASTSNFNPNNNLLALKSKIVASSDIYITGVYPNFVAKEIDLSGGYSMYLHNIRLGNESYYINDTVLTKVTGAGNSIKMSGTQQYYERCDLHDVVLKGHSIIGGNVDFYGEVINVDTLVANHYRTIDVHGNFTNNGVVPLHNSYYASFNFYKNFTNNGFFNIAAISFIGTSDHHLITTPGNWIKFNSDLNSPDGKIIAGSDLSLSSGAGYLNAKEIDLTTGFDLYLDNVRVGWNSSEYRTVITGGGNSITMKGVSSYYEKCDLYDVNLRGFSIIGLDADFYGEIVNKDTLSPTNNNFVDVHGNFTNEGAIIDKAGYGWWLSFNFNKNLTNNGKCEVNNINFLGANDHILKTSNENYIYFRGEFNAHEGKIIAGSDLYISSGMSYLIAKEIDLTNGYNLHLDNVKVGYSTAAYTNKIFGSKYNFIKMKGASSYYENCEIHDITLAGRSIVAVNLDLYGDVENIDTIITNHYRTIDVFGNFINNGAVLTYYGYKGDFNFHKNFKNIGTFESRQANFVGTEDQYVLVEQAFNSDIDFRAVIGISSFQWQKDGANISGATNSDLTFTKLSESEFGVYQCITDGGNSRLINVQAKESAAFEIMDVVISNLSETQTKVEWKTTVPAKGFIFYAENDTTNGYPLEAMEPDGYLLEHSLTLENLSNGSTYYFIIDQNDEQLNNIRSISYSFVAGGTTVVIDKTELPKVFTLSQNYPNPFNPTTTIKFTLAEDGFTTLKVFDILGREVTTLVNEELIAGVHHKAIWDASQMSSGVYFYRLEAGTSSLIKKLLLLY